MKLDTYLREQGLTLEQFAKKAGLVGKQVVHNYRRGTRFPTAENLRRVREATNGAVTADDFVDQHAGASPPRTAEVKPKAKRAASPPPAESDRASGAQAPDSPPPRRRRAA